MTRIIFAVLFTLYIGPAFAAKTGSEQSGDEHITDFLKTNVATVNQSDGSIKFTDARLTDVVAFCGHLRGSASLHYHGPNRFFMGCDIPSAKGGKPRQIMHFFIKVNENESGDSHPIPTVILESIYYAAPRKYEDDQKALTVTLEFYHTSAPLSNADFDRLMRETRKR